MDLLEIEHLIKVNRPNGFLGISEKRDTYEINFRGNVKLDQYDIEIIQEIDEDYRFMAKPSMAGTILTFIVRK